MWQALFDEMKEAGLVILAVALDEPEAARPWIDAAGPAYPCLIDRDHRLAELYGLVNVPEAVWIDETGRIVRPPETAGSTDGFRSLDRKTFTLPEAVIAERQRVKTLYLEAIRDWVRNGTASRHALDTAQIAARWKPSSGSVAQAHTHFRLAQFLLRAGRNEEARRHAELAIDAHPESWAIWRQMADKDERGLAAGPAFWERVQALGDRPYYRPIEIDGMKPA